jgi:hypothetical protein
MKKFNRYKLLFIDIETVPEEASFEELSLEMQQLWNKHIVSEVNDVLTPASLYMQKAGTLASFGRIICISVGYFDGDDNADAFIVKSYTNPCEIKLLNAFAADVEMLAKRGIVHFAGHNIRDFDLPFLQRRMWIHKVRIPSIMDFRFLKPWEITVWDTCHLWRQGNYRYYTSLELLSKVLDIEFSVEYEDETIGVHYHATSGRQRLEYLQEMSTKGQHKIMTAAKVLMRLLQAYTAEENNIQFRVDATKTDFFY